MKMIIILILSLLKITLFQEIKTNLDIVKIAREKGYNLRDPEDIFFHDICHYIREIKKDITLEYRRKYYFFPSVINDKLNLKLISKSPIRNNSNHCFSFNNSFSIINIAILCFLPLFIIQFALIIISIILRTKDSMKNTPLKKVEAEKKKKKKETKEKKEKKNGPSTYAQFIPEVDIHKINESLQPLEENEKNNTNKNMELGLSNKKLESPSNIDNDSILQSSNDHLNKSKNEKEKDNNEEKEPSKGAEKSIENYTFGIQFGTEFKFSSNKNVKDEKKTEKKEDKMKRIQYVYNQINQDKRAKAKNNNNINADAQIAISNVNANEKFYTREEYFYFKYLLARIEDKRTVFQIYLDLLEQCQIIFKFFFVPFNIYEDRKLQALYYLIKINLYFLINCLLIKSSVINDIYDGKNYLINDLGRSFLATIYTFGISIFIYYLTNVKTLLIKRRYKLMNLKINIPSLNTEIVKMTYNYCLTFLFNKLILLLIVYLLIFLYSSYICFSFCNIYYYTQKLLLKCVIISITISLITPFIVCWIPAFLRKMAIKNKNIRFYELVKIIELLFIPW